MGFYKEYPNRKDWRARYRRGAAFSSGCRPHGSCDWCLSARMHRHRKREVSAADDVRDFLLFPPAADDA